MTTRIRVVMKRRMEAMDWSRGEWVNDGHLRQMQDKTKCICNVKYVPKRAFSLKGILHKYAA
jgi:hypothetical protein